MHRAATLSFAVSLSGLLYVYVGYPMLVALFGRLCARPVRKGDYLPRVTLLVAAYNERDAIARTLRNKLQLDYPPERLELVVVSDGSDDGTDDVVTGFADRGVRLIRQEPRQGKTAALNRGVDAASGDVLVFSDANSLYAPDALRRLVRCFHDPEVGYVTGKMIYTDPDGTPVGDGCSAYMRYENRLRADESRLGSIVGVDGGIDAVRRELYRPMRPDQLPDFVLPLGVVEQGYRVIYEPEALLREATLGSTEDEYRMRVRVSLRALWAIHDMRHLLNPLRHAVFAWQLWSHKVLRYTACLLLLGAFVSNALLWDAGAVWRGVLALQLAAYLAALVSAGLASSGSRIRLLWVPYYFTLINVAAGHALVKFLLGRKQVVWQPRRG